MEMHALKHGPVRPATNVVHLAPMPETPLPVVKVPEGQAPALAQEHKHGAGTHSKSEEKTVWGVAFPYIGHTIKRAFVTGASGFVGRTLIAHLRSKGVENVVVLVPNERAELICRKAGATEFVLGDSNMQTSMLTYAMLGCDTVFHLASHNDLSDPYEVFERINVQGTRNVSRSALAAGVKRFVLCSSDAVLACGEPLISVDEAWPVPKHSQSYPYSLSKAIAEQSVLDLNDPEMACMVVRARWIWGKGDTVFLPYIINLMDSEVWTWVDGGGFMTSTCHVKNLCEGLYLAAVNGNTQQIYFITDGRPVNARDFITKLLATQDREDYDDTLTFGCAVCLATLSEMWAKCVRSCGGKPVIWTRQHVASFGTEVTLRDEKARRELGFMYIMSIDSGLREMDGAQPEAVTPGG